MLEIVNVLIFPLGKIMYSRAMHGLKVYPKKDQFAVAVI